MPIYEYRCEPCDHSFETLVRRHDDAAHCPKCGGIDLAKQFSVPAAPRGAATAGAALPVCETGAKNFGCGPGFCGSGMCSTE